MKSTGKIRFQNSRKKHLNLLAIILFAIVGSILVYISSAQKIPPPPPPPPLGYIANPPFAYTCGFNVIIEIDTSSSRGIEFIKQDIQHIKSFMNAFNGTDTLFSFTVSGLDDDVWVPYTSDKSKIINTMDSIDSNGGSIDINLKSLVQYANYRPSKQTIIMIFTDGGDPGRYEEDYKEPSNQLKASGARLIGFVLPGQKGSFDDVQKFTGPNTDTGNILTSDVVHSSNYALLTSQLKQFATVDSCNPPPAHNPGGPVGGGGNGTGTNGNGQGTGSGSGGGGGGSSASQQDDEPNSLPTSGGQGTQAPTSLEPSPFFDGKEFKPGSDKDTLANTVSSTGKKLARTWPIIITVLILGGVAGYIYWHKKRRPNQ